MEKRILCFILCIAVLLPVFCFGVRAETQPTEPETQTTETTETTEQVPEEQDLVETLKSLLVEEEIRNEDQRLRQQILKTHIKSLEETGHESLGGRCGLQVSWELYLLGINQVLTTHHGKDHYDFYSAMGVTSGGYTVRAYSVQNYSMLQALNLITKNGTVDVYNVMVGFERTNTEAGAQYGHVCFIHGIVDGMVYFVEGFGTQFGTIEGEPIVLSMERFANWFAGWAEYEGLVYFGTKSPLDSCTYYPADLFVESSAQVELYLEPDTESEPVRAVQLGERLHATGIFEDMHGQRYYRINDDGVIGYVPVERLECVLLNYESVTAQALTVPELMEVGQRFKPGGKVATELLEFDRVRLVITDVRGKDLREVELTQGGKLCDLNQFVIQKKVDTSILSTGVYTYSLFADTKNHFVQNGQLETDRQSICVASARFGVGQTRLPEQPQMQPKQIVQGWSYEDGKWYFYEDGQPRTGWLGYKGHDYYLDETGAALTGWVQVNGKMRYFSQTGTMRTGWLKTDAGICYMLRNGVAATGWRTVDGSRYCFDEQGYMLCGGWTKLGQQLYYFYADGAAATGWVTMDTDVYSFHADGHLLAKRVEQEGKIQIVNYDGSWEPEG